VKIWAVLALCLVAGIQMSGAQAMTVAELVKVLGLEPHVEGGYFKRTFEASHRDKIDEGNGPRFTMTSIFYLLTADSRIGHWHRNKSDIVHYFHLGDPITYYLIHPDGKLETVVMGPDPLQGQQLQLVVRGGVWKASHLAQGDYGLISEAVSPGFEYEDMSLGLREQLTAQFPQHQQLIDAYSLR
jgi:predicted cupin superfamily sugar epimerase